MNLYLMILPGALILGTVTILLLGSRRKIRSREVFQVEHFRIEKLIEELRSNINTVLNTDVSELNLNRLETNKREQQQERLRRATRESCLGDAGDREYLKEYLRDILQTELGVNELTIFKVISFDEPERMSSVEKFEYLYYIYRREFAIRVIDRMMEDFRWNRPKYDEDGKPFFCITTEDIDEAYRRCAFRGTYSEMIETVVQRCYEKLYGHDVADILIMDESIDGVSGGVGGRTRTEYNYLEELMGTSGKKEQVSNSYDVIYCVHRGRLYRMKFLSFGRAQTLERVVKNIYRYNTRNTLSQRHPVLNASFKNNSRIVVARPPVSDGWAFYVRKFASSDARSIESLITDTGCDKVIGLLRCITASELNFVVSGNTGGGKTTLVKSLIGYINPQYTLRVVESSFELNVNNLYPERNVHVMQERGDFTVYDAIAASKKMDTDVLILGEVNEPKIAGAFIQVAQSGSRMAITTLHHESTPKLIEYMRNALVSEFGISDAKIAEKQVVDSINFDVHMVHDVSGHHYIERITEIVPYEPQDIPQDMLEANREFYERMTNPHLYECRNLIEFDKEVKTYRITGKLSDYTASKIMQVLDISEIPEEFIMRGAG